MVSLLRLIPMDQGPLITMVIDFWLSYRDYKCSYFAEFMEVMTGGDD